MIWNNNSLSNVFASKNNDRLNNTLSHEVQSERKRFSDKISARLEWIFFQN